MSSLEFIISTRFSYLILFLLGSVSWLLTVFEKPLRTKCYVTPPLVLTVLGIVIRQFIDQTHSYETAPDWTGVNNLLMDVSQFVIAMQLMATALDLPRQFWLERVISRSLVVMLTIGMLLTWLLTAIILYAFLYSITSFRVCVLIAACLTPTDPILAHAVVVGEFAEEKIPQHVRDTLNSESSFNDGTAYPFVQFGVLLLTHDFADDAGSFIGEWILITWLYEIVLGVIVSIFMGWMFGRLHKWCYRHQLIAHHTTIPVPFFLVLTVLGLCDLCSLNGVLGTFVAGCVFALEDSVHQQMAATKLQDTADILCNVFFILFGVFIPFSDMSSFMSAGTMIGLIICVMLFKRLPVMLMLKPLFPKGTTYADLIFTGWFGPIGVAGFYYVVFIAFENHSLDTNPTFDPSTTRLITCVVSLIILSSVIIHAITAVPITRRLSPFFSKPSRRLAQAHLTHHIQQIQQQQYEQQEHQYRLERQVTEAQLTIHPEGEGISDGDGQNINMDTLYESHHTSSHIPLPQIFNQPSHHHTIVDPVAATITTSSTTSSQDPICDKLFVMEPGGSQQTITSHGHENYNNSTNINNPQVTGVAKGAGQGTAVHNHDAHHDLPVSPIHHMNVWSCESSPVLVPEHSSVMDAHVPRHASECSTVMDVHVDE